MASVRKISKTLLTNRASCSSIVSSLREFASDPSSTGNTKIVQPRPNTRAYASDVKSGTALSDPMATMPQKSSYTKDGCEARRAWVEKFANTSLFNSAAWYPEESGHTPEILEGNIERPIGLTKIPLAVAGPLYFKGEHAKGWLLAPVATTEGALVASMCRGAKVLNMSGGVKTCAIQQRMTRAPIFCCASPLQAVKLGEWIVKNRERMQQEIVSKSSRHARLMEIMPAYDMDAVHALFCYETGDAAGQNMVTMCTWEATKWIRSNAPKELDIEIRFSIVEGNMSGDKKSSSFNALSGRGISVAATAEIPESVLQDVLRINSDTLTEGLRYWHRIAVRNGQKGGLNVNTSNTLGAMFTALGQDIASVSESAISHFDIIKREHPTGGVCVSLYLPCLHIGTVGGGTKLPTQRECLEMVGCYGTGKVRKLAELMAGYCLALDLSSIGALIGGEFADAHDRLGRNRPEGK